MANKLDRIEKDIQKVKSKIAEYNKQLRELSAPFQNVIFRRNGMSLFAGWHTCVMQPYTPANLPA